MSISLTIQPYDDIQNFIDILEQNGGGVLNLNPVDTFYATSDILLPSNVYLQGPVRNTTVIDFGGGAYSIRAVGGNSYTDGTVDTTDGSPNVVGTGTSWDAEMEGQTMFLNDSYYIIDTVTDATNIVLETPYSGDNLSGATYAIADVVENVLIENITVQNSLAPGIMFQYNVQSTVSNVNAYDCSTGFEVFDSVADTFELLSLDANDINLDFDHVYSWTVTNAAFTNSNSGDNIVMTNSGNSTFYNNGLDNSFLSGLSLTNCNGVAFISNTFSGSGTHGVELVAGNTDLSFSGNLIVNNSGDGIKLTDTADGHIIGSGNTIKNNTGYGVNIADANCDGNIIGMNVISGNGSGSVNDSGTGTLIRSNIGVADN